MRKPAKKPAPKPSKPAAKKTVKNPAKPKPVVRRMKAEEFAKAIDEAAQAERCSDPTIPTTPAACSGSELGVSEHTTLQPHDLISYLELTHDIVLFECGQEIERFNTIAAAKQYVQDANDGEPQEWVRKQGEGKDRWMETNGGQFKIKSMPKRKEGENCSDPTSVAADAGQSSSSRVAGASSAPSDSPLASLLRQAIKHQQSEAAAETVAGYTPTAEQRAVLTAATAKGLRCLVLPAGAGAGKTSTLRMLEEVLPGNGQYTAFNRSLVNESKAKFKKARCSTTHGLAFGTVGKQFSHRLNGGRMRSEQIAQRLGIADMGISTGVTPDGTPALRQLQAGWLAGQVMVAVRRFCQSADELIGREHFKRIDGIDQPSPDGKTAWANNDVVKGYLLPFAEKAWADLSSPTGTLPFSHDVYVKLWQLGKGPNKPTIPASYILLDEAQDTAPVFLDVLKQQTHALLIFVGDSNQAIYEWRGAVDAMQAFPDAPRRMLSQSFRFGQRVADVANSVLRGLNDPTDLILKGLPSISSVVTNEPYGNPKCVLTRTNGAAVTAIMQAQAEGKTTHLIGSVTEVLAFLRASRDLQQGKTTSHPDLGCFSTWAEVVTYSETDEGQELRLWVKLIKEFSIDAVIRALEAQTPEENADLVVCTAHKSKGREWTSVKLAGDFPPACRMSDPDRRLLYVAVTRAKRVLDISACPSFREFRDPRTGESSSGIRIEWTGPMPNLDETGIEADEPVEEPVPIPTMTPVPEAQPLEFNWTNYSGKWCIVGPSDQVGQRVDVIRKDGSKSIERLGQVVKQLNGKTIYAVSR